MVGCSTAPLPAAAVVAVAVAASGHAAAGGGDRVGGVDEGAVFVSL